MNIVLSTHNITLTDAIEKRIRTKLQKLEHLDQHAIDARVTLEQDHTRTPTKRFKCSIRLGVRGPDLFAEDSETDLYAAIDKVIKKIEQQIRKRRNKRLAKKQRLPARGKMLAKESGL